MQIALHLISKYEGSPPLYLILNDKWNVLKDRKQWYAVLHTLWEKEVEPKKACLA